MDPKLLEPVVVRTVNDIQRQLAELDPSTNPPRDSVRLNTQMSVNDGRKMETYAVSTVTRSKSKRDLLVEGFTLLKQRAEAPRQEVESVEINGRLVKPAALGDGYTAHSWVDPLVKQWLGGYRDGVTIYWDLDDGYRYKYCIFAHKLTRVPSAQTNKSAAVSTIP